MIHCPDCGEQVPSLCEGRCADCYEEIQNSLDEFNARYDWWESLSPAEKEKQIRQAY